MKKWSVGLVLVIVLGGSAFYYWKKTKPKNTETETTPVLVIQGVIEETVDATGEVAPLNRVEIKPPVSGRVEKILKDEGDRVTAGDILAWMSSSDRAAIVDAARAQGPDVLKKWEDTYKLTPIVAPLSGTVILRNIVVGQTVDLSMVLFAVSDQLIVLAHVDETDIARVKVGQGARVTLDAYVNHPIEGRVMSVLYEGVNVSNVITYGVKIHPMNVPSFFRSQMTANIGLIVKREENALLVPSAGVKTSSSGNSQVLVPGPDNKPVFRDITVGLDNGEQTQVLTGLEAGDTVLLVKKSYRPQEVAASSPLVMSGPKNKSTKESR